MRRRSPAAVRRVAGFLALALTATVLTTAAPAGAQSVSQLRQQQREIQQKRAAQASQINVLKADEQQLAAALDALEANRRATEEAAAAARERAAAQAARAAQARATLEKTTVELEALRATVRQLAVREYMRGSAPDLDVGNDPSNPMDAVRRHSLLSAAVGRSDDAADALKKAQDDQELERKAADEAAEQAAEEQRQVEQRLVEVRAAAEQQQAVAAQAEARLERALAEADALASTDAGLASKISAANAALARQLARSSASSSSSSSSGGGRVSPGASRSSNAGSLTTVGGITVSSSIAGNLAALLNAARADGIILGGGGYRDPAGQIATRRRNCGSSNYDVYQKPASSCRPPTARPGSSMHERGLAIDFTSSGGTLNRSSAGFKWLKANAGRYGLRNLPSEPWHWSTTGD